MDSMIIDVKRRYRITDYPISPRLPETIMARTQDGTLIE